MTHELRTWPDFYDAILDGRKRFEIRKDDRGFEIGDLLVLREWRPAVIGRPAHAIKAVAGGYTGRQANFRLLYIMRGALAWEMGLRRGFVALGISRL